MQKFALLLMEKSYDFHPIHCTAVSPDHVWVEKYPDYDWDKIINSSHSQLSAHKEGLEIINYLIDHAIRTDDYLVFLKCKSISCSRCRSFGEDRSGTLIETIRETFSGSIPDFTIKADSHCPSLAEIIDNPNHYVHQFDSGISSTSLTLYPTHILEKFVLCLLVRNLLRYPHKISIQFSCRQGEALDFMS